MDKMNKLSKVMKQDFIKYKEEIILDCYDNEKY